MSCKTETTTISHDETDYEISVTQWPAEKAMLMKFKLMKILGPTFESLNSLIKSKDKEDLKAIGDIVNAMFSNASPEELNTFVKECVVLNVAFGGKKITAEQYAGFSGDEIMLIYKMFFFVLRTNYSGLLKGRKVGDVLAKTETL